MNQFDFDQVMPSNRLAIRRSRKFWIPPLMQRYDAFACSSFQPLGVLDHTHTLNDTNG